MRGREKHRGREKGREKERESRVWKAARFIFFVHLFDKNTFARQPSLGLRKY